MLRATLLAFLLVFAFACGGGDEPKVEGPPDQSYEVRGEVRSMPRSGGVAVAHEEIPEFVSIDGEVVGMEAMTMTFPVTHPDLLQDLAPGDKIAFDLEVRWKGGNPVSVSRIEKLAASTELELDNVP